MFVPSMADAGAVLVTPRSAEVATVLVVVAVLLAGSGSAVGELAEAVFEIVEPPGADSDDSSTSLTRRVMVTIEDRSFGGARRENQGADLVCGS